MWIHRVLKIVLAGDKCQVLESNAVGHSNGIGIKYQRMTSSNDILSSQFTYVDTSGRRNYTIAGKGDAIDAVASSPARIAKWPGGKRRNSGLKE